MQMYLVKYQYDMRTVLTNFIVFIAALALPNKV